MAYGSDSAFTAYLASMGLSLPGGANASMLRAVGSAYVNGYGSRFTGQVTDALQEDEWPRIGAYRGLRPLPSDSTPAAVEHAAYFAGYYAAVNPGAFFEGGTGAELVKRETVGPLTFEYAISSNMSPDQIAKAMKVGIPFVDDLLGPYLEDETEQRMFILSVGPSGC